MIARDFSLPTRFARLLFPISASWELSRAKTGTGRHSVRQRVVTRHNNALLTELKFSLSRSRAKLSTWKREFKSQDGDVQRLCTGSGVQMLQGTALNPEMLTKMEPFDLATNDTRSGFQSRLWAFVRDVNLPKRASSGGQNLRDFALWDGMARHKHGKSLKTLKTSKFRGEADYGKLFLKETFIFSQCLHGYHKHSSHIQFSSMQSLPGSSAPYPSFSQR